MPPDATLIRQVGAEGFENITGWQGAFFGHVYGTQLSIDEVFAFHDTELTKLGWKPDLKPILSSGELRGWGWCKPRMFFRLAIFDPAEYDRTVVLDGAAYRVVFDARIDGTLQPCPYVPRPLTTLPPPRP
ncbi:MAG: hypothetical protein AUJ06_00370 [Chloroflexi bacterium 13_1_40CM_3_70_6]|nr:MAG: hypothetical protein AUJ06_00370 [Chloroflexi bacterium 13_1_40CM_3_70_6]